MQTCTDCGAENGDDANYCQGCGAPLGEESAGDVAHRQFQSEVAATAKALPLFGLNFAALFIAAIAYGLLRRFAGVEFARVHLLGGMIAIVVLVSAWWMWRDYRS